MMGIFPASGVGAFISGSTFAGGQMTPSERASVSLRFWLGAAPVEAGGFASPGPVDVEGAQGVVTAAGGWATCAAAECSHAEAQTPAAHNAAAARMKRYFHFLGFDLMRNNGRSAYMFRARRN
jgi:hypothetical protein